MKVVFMGTPAAALPALRAVAGAGHEIVLVVTQPDRPAGRGRQPQAPPVKQAASELGWPVIQPAKVRTGELAAAIAGGAPDVIVVVAYGRILPRAILDAAPLGAVNLHFSMLPAYRGAAPVQWALARGEARTGVTTFRLDEGLDTGGILLQRQVSIGADETAVTLLPKLSEIGAALVVETLSALAAGSIAPRPQNDAEATLAPVLTREDGFFDPAWRARDLEGRVRGFDPWPGVHASSAGRRIRIARACSVPGTIDAPAGTVVDLQGDSIRLACAAGTVARIDTLQREGGRVVSAREAVNGRLLRPGDRLERPERSA